MSTNKPNMCRKRLNPMTKMSICKLYYNKAVDWFIAHIHTMSCICVHFSYFFDILLSLNNLVVWTLGCNLVVFSHFVVP